MAKIDKLKEEIGWLKTVFGILIITDISLVGWLTQNYTKAEKVLLFGCGGTVFLVTSLIILTNIAAYKRINELEDL